MPVKNVIPRHHNGRRERVDVVSAMAETQSDSIENAGDISPIAGPNQALLAECEFLASGTQRHRTFFGVADLNPALPQVDAVAKGRRVSKLSERDARVLALGVYLEPAERLQPETEAKALEQVHVILPLGEPVPEEAFLAKPDFSIKPYPRRQLIVQRCHWSGGAGQFLRRRFSRERRRCNDEQNPPEYLLVHGSPRLRP
jgi:hypothetical protein